MFLCVITIIYLYWKAAMWLIVTEANSKLWPNNLCGHHEGLTDCQSVNVGYCDWGRQQTVAKHSWGHREGRTDIISSHVRVKNSWRQPGQTSTGRERADHQQGRHKCQWTQSSLHRPVPGGLLARRAVRPRHRRRPTRLCCSCYCM